MLIQGFTLYLGCPQGVDYGPREALPRAQACRYICSSSSAGPAWWSWGVNVTEGEEERDGDGSTDDAEHAQDWDE